MTFKSRLFSSLRKNSSSPEYSHDDAIGLLDNELPADDMSDSDQQSLLTSGIKQQLETAYHERLIAEDQAIKEAHKRIEAENIARVTAEARARAEANARMAADTRIQTEALATEQARNKARAEALAIKEADARRELDQRNLAMALFLGLVVLGLSVGFAIVVAPVL